MDPRQLGLLAVCGAAIPLLLYGVATRVVKAAGWRPEVAGVVVLGAMIANVALFLSAFTLAFHGQEGLSLVAAFDVGNSLVASSVAHYVAGSYGRSHTWNWRVGIRRILTMPLLWANLLGIAANLGHWGIPAVPTHMLELLAAANTALAMLTLGAFIEFRAPAWKPMLTAVAIRMGLGWVLGQVFVGLAGLTGLARTVVSVGAASPVAVMALIYISMEGMDVELAAATLSLSILLGMVLTPLLFGLYR